MLRRLWRLGLRKTAVGRALGAGTPLVRFFSATFLRLLERSAFLYRNRKNGHIPLERYVQYDPNIYAKDIDIL
jgi:hypothetical protein